MDRTLNADRLAARIKELHNPTNWPDEVFSMNLQWGLCWFFLHAVHHLGQAEDPIGIHPKTGCPPTLRIDWFIGCRHDVTLKVDLDNAWGDWSEVDLSKNWKESRELNLARSDEWDWVAQRLHALAGGPSAIENETTEGSTKGS